MSSDIDYISFCPSLVDILQLIDHPDINSYRLVSKKAVKVKVFVVNPQWDASSDTYATMYRAIYQVKMTNDAVRLSGCNNQSIIHHYITHNRSLTEDQEDPQGTGDSRTENNVLTFRSRGLRDEIGALFSILLRAYHTRSIFLPVNCEKSQASLCSDILDLLCQHSKANRCKHLGLRAVSCSNWIDESQLKAAIKALNPVRLELTATVNHINMLPFYISNYHLNTIMFFTTLETFNTLQPLVDVIRNWPDDALHCRKCSFWNDGPFHWSTKEIIEPFSSLPGFRLPKAIEKQQIRKLIKRKLLAVVEKSMSNLIGISYSSKHNIISLLSLTAVRRTT